MNFKKWVKSIQTADYNGARTVFQILTNFRFFVVELHSPVANSSPCTRSLAGEPAMTLGLVYEWPAVMRTCMLGKSYSVQWGETTSETNAK